MSSDQKLILAPLINSRIMCVLTFVCTIFFLTKHHLILNANTCVQLIKKPELTIMLVRKREEDHYTSARR